MNAAFCITAKSVADWQQWSTRWADSVAKGPKT
jgi:hypothetical protein